MIQMIKSKDFNYVLLRIAISVILVYNFIGVTDFNQW